MDYIQVHPGGFSLGIDIHGQLEIFLDLHGMGLHGALGGRACTIKSGPAYHT